MRVCVLYTGALRTIQKTIHYLRKNVLLHPDVHVFACLQNDSSESNETVQTWLQKELGAHLIHLQWFNKDDIVWKTIQKDCLNSMLIPDNTQQYLLQSGSMIEYYQMSIVYNAMCNYEMIHNSSYEYVVRCRTDTIFCKPIDFNWLYLTEEDVIFRIHKIITGLKSQGREMIGEDVFNIFMISLIDPLLIDNIGDMYEIIRERKTFYSGSNTLDIPTILDYNTLMKYIHSGKYILTFRKNLLYIVKRDYFRLIPLLGRCYGLTRLPKQDNDEDAYWWNAESQFQAICYYSGLTIFNYDTEYECASLYQYKKEKYFDENYQLIRNNMIYCLVRY